MLVAVLFAAVFGSEPVFEFLPADRSQVPVLNQRSFTIDEWQRIDEDTAKFFWKQERSLRSLESVDKEGRRLMRIMNAIDRKWGIATNPDPEEPKESKYFPKKDK